MCLLNVPPQCRSFIIVHGSHSDYSYWIYALLSRNQPCRNYALWEALFGKIWWEEAQKHFNGPSVNPCSPGLALVRANLKTLPNLLSWQPDYCIPVSHRIKHFRRRRRKKKAFLGLCPTSFVKCLLLGMI